MWNETNNAKPAATGNENFSVVCGLPGALWSKQIIIVNGTEIVDPSSNPGPWKNHIECLFNYSKEFQETVMKSAKWIKDVPHKRGMHLTKSGNEGTYNQSYVDRRAGINKGNWEEFVIPLSSDIITATRYLPPGYKIEIVLNRFV